MVYAIIYIQKIINLEYIMKYDFVTVGGSTEDITLYTSDGLLIDNKDDVLMQ